MKVWIREIPSYLKNVAVDYDCFLKENLPCESFFVFKRTTAVSSLDNPCYDLIKNIKRPAN